MGITTMLFSEACQALYPRGSNLNYSGYPSHNCFAPAKPLNNPFFNSQWEIDNYNNHVRRYNQELKDYIECINTYVLATNNNINKIMAKANEAISTTRSL